jgi:hypothetical protein
LGISVLFKLIDRRVSRFYPINKIFRIKQVKTLLSQNKEVKKLTENNSGIIDKIKF